MRGERRVRGQFSWEFPDFKVNSLLSCETPRSWAKQAHWPPSAGQGEHRPAADGVASGSQEVGSLIRHAKAVYPQNKQEATKELMGRARNLITWPRVGVEPELTPENYSLHSVSSHPYGCIGNTTGCLQAWNWMPTCILWLSQSPEPYGRNSHSQLPVCCIPPRLQSLKNEREPNNGFPRPHVPLQPPSDSSAFLYEKNCSDNCLFLSSPNPHLPFPFELMTISLLGPNILSIG